MSGMRPNSANQRGNRLANVSVPAIGSLWGSYPSGTWNLRGWTNTRTKQSGWCQWVAMLARGCPGDEHIQGLSFAAVNIETLKIAFLSYGMPPYTASKCLAVAASLDVR